MQKRTVFSLLAAIILGAVAGYLLQGFLRRGTLSPADPAPFMQDRGAVKTDFTADELKGFCCNKKGEVCTVSPSDEECLGGGGYVFAYSESDCAIVCDSPAQ